MKMILSATDAEKSDDKTFTKLHTIRSECMQVPGVRVAVVVHIFYLEIASEVYGFLRNITEPFDLVITTPHHDAVDALFGLFSPLASGVTVLVTENRGRDVGPFMVAHRKHMLDNYDAVLKLHSKRSLHIRRGGHLVQSGNHWRLDSFQSLCGSSQIVQHTIALLRTGRVGVVGVHGYYLDHQMYWETYRKRIRQLLQILHHPEISAHHVAQGFFAGTMFWYAPAALSSLHEIPDDMLQFESERGQKDGTLAHVLERLFGILARQSDYTLSSLELAGRDFSELSFHQFKNNALGF